MDPLDPTQLTASQALSRFMEIYDGLSESQLKEPVDTWVWQKGEMCKISYAETLIQTARNGRRSTQKSERLNRLVSFFSLRTSVWLTKVTLPQNESPSNVLRSYFIVYILPVFELRLVR